MSYTTILFNIGSPNQTCDISVSNFPEGRFAENPGHDLADYLTIRFRERDAGSSYGISLTLAQAQELRTKLDAALDHFEDERPGATVLCNCRHYPINQCDCQPSETEAAAVTS